jgi:hypothetical protein
LFQIRKKWLEPGPEVLLKSKNQSTLVKTGSKFLFILFSHDILEGTCQVSPEVSKKDKKEGVCLEKQNVHMNGGYVFQMNTLHITVSKKTDHYTYLWHKIPFMQGPFHSEQGGILSRRNIHGHKVPSKFTDLFVVKPKESEGDLRVAPDSRLKMPCSERPTTRPPFCFELKV